MNYYAAVGEIEARLRGAALPPRTAGFFRALKALLLLGRTDLVASLCQAFARSLPAPGAGRGLALEPPPGPEALRPSGIVPGERALDNLLTCIELARLHASRREALHAGLFMVIAL